MQRGGRDGAAVEERPTGRGFSVAVLAGGKSLRMGQDKAFLTLDGKTFISIVIMESLKVSDDVIVAIGTKEVAAFAGLLGKNVRVVPDAYHTSNPIGGILSAFQHALNPYAAVVACDLPMVKSGVLNVLFGRARGHDAAVPVWENGNTEPLCAVYNVAKVVEACLAALEAGPIGPRNLLSKLSDVRYVRVEYLRGADPHLVSFTNVNTAQDYESLGTLEF